MISSVIARFAANIGSKEHIIEQVSNRNGLEAGELVDGRLLPVTIDASSRHESEEATRWLREIDGIEFVDVVFVHFEEADCSFYSGGARGINQPFG